MPVTDFADEIEANRSAERVPTEEMHLVTADSSLDVRLRGGFVTNLTLTSPTTGRSLPILYFDREQLAVAKPTGSHVMSPAGPYDGLGGQHGFARWADYEELPRPADEEAYTTLQARRSDGGPALTKSYSLSSGALVSRTTLFNPTPQPLHTSLGEHYYFDLQDEQFDGLKLDGQSLDEALGEGAQVALESNSQRLPDGSTKDGTQVWDFTSGQAVIDFPFGHRVRLSASYIAQSEFPLQLWVWHRPGTPSICFEPVIGVAGGDANQGLTIEPNTAASLITTIEHL